MKTIEAILQSDVIQALGWTLVHAIWQVAAIALLLMLGLALLRKSSPVIRYGAALSAMVSICVLSAVTFLVYLRIVPDAGPVSVQAAEMRLVVAAEASRPGLLPALMAFFQRHLFTLLALWMAGVVLLSLRFAGSMLFLRRLRKEAIPATGKWVSRLARMAGQSGIRRAVKLAESAMVNAPVMIGHLKPLILVPAGMLAAIPHDQVEAILAHELAHIRRNDFLVNLLQSLAEIVYFFHPGIWWVSGIIRRERELCCDDMATRQGCSPVTLAFALSEVGEWMHARRDEKLVLAFSGKKEQPLLARVKRLLGQEPSNPFNVVPAGTLAAVLVFVLLLSGSGRVLSSSAEDGNTVVERVAFQETAGTDTLPSPERGAVEIRRNRDSGDETQTNDEQDVRPVSPESSPRRQQGIPDASALPDPSALPKPSALAEPSALPEPPALPSLTEMPRPPRVDTMPTPPPAAPVPPVPPVADSAAWAQFGEAMGDFGAAMADWAQSFTAGQDTAKIPEVKFNFKFDKEDWKDFEMSMEDFGKKMEVWGEEFGRKMEAWAKANEPKLKEFELKMKLWEKENKPRLEEYERKMEEYQRKLQQDQRRRQEMQQNVDEVQRKIDETQQNLNEKQRKLHQKQRSQKEEQRSQNDARRDNSDVQQHIEKEIQLELKGEHQEL